MGPFTFFNDKQFYKSLFTIAIPIMLQNLVNTLVNMVDTIMIGRLGTVEIAAVGLGNQFFFTFNTILFGICSGSAIFTAQFWGKRDIPGIRKNTGFSLILVVSVTLAFTLGALLYPGGIIRIYSRDPAVIASGAVYLKTVAPSFIPFGVGFVFIQTLRSVEKVRLPMVSTLIALFLNIGLNYLFIFGSGPIPAMGVAGAALATVIARFTEAGILVAVSYARRYPPAGNFREFTDFNRPFIGRFLHIVSPVILNEFIWSLGVMVENIIIAQTHTNAIAAFNITNTFSGLTWVIFIGLGTGVAVLIGKKIGEGDEKTARDYAFKITRFAPLLAGGAALLILSISRFLPFIFKVNSGVFSIITVMFLIMAAVYPFRAFNMAMVVGVCRSGGDTKFCILYDVLFMWVLSIPLAAAASFVFHAPVWVAYLCICIEDPIKMLLGLWRLRSGKWLHNVIKKLS
ncbi:MAG: MATE family efflux transporter [Spirochaetaceae bacterium]|jgi:putative MATE family efflux protein|nr:MATE family efflux transporter [Spirochaetaceae bacterium]